MLCSIDLFIMFTMGTISSALQALISFDETSSSPADALCLSESMTVFTSQWLVLTSLSLLTTVSG